MKPSNPILLILLFALSVSARAQFIYETNNGAITITGYDCANGGGAVTIPGTIHNLPVIEIGEALFLTAPG